MKVLSVDGGGVRGAAAASFLAELESKLPAGETLYSYFDAFVGSSTGALIISAIVYGGYSAAYIRDSLYSLENMEKVMPSSMRDKLFGIIQLEPEYDGKGKRSVIESHVSLDRTIADTDKFVCIPWTNIDTEKPEFAKSWDPLTSKFRVVDILDATTSAPGYFPYAEFEDTEGNTFRGIDGSVFANDPTDMMVFQLMEKMSVDTKMTILSVGTGMVSGHWDGNKIHRNAGGIPWFVTGDLMNLMFDLPRYAVEYRMKCLASNPLNRIRYLRIKGEVECDSMDNVCEKNINSLKESGQEWWEQYRKEVEDILKLNLKE